MLGGQLEGRQSAGAARVAAWAGSVAALILIAVALLAPAGANAAAVDQSRGEILEYWTQERMDAALPGELLAAGGLDGLVSPRAQTAADGTRFAVGAPAAPGNRTHGKVFLTINGADYLCSATATRSYNRSLVTTAGHCVSEGSTLASNWMFIPAYSGDAEPFGRWTANRLDATNQWKSGADLRFDVGMAVVGKNSEDEALEQVVGGRVIGFNQQRKRIYRSFGYPAQSPPFEFTGDREFACNSSWRGDDDGLDAPRPMRIACDMTEGSSGGGWVSDGTLLSVNSYKLGVGLIGAADNRFMFGPYFGDSVRSLYERMRGKVILCAGREATIFGTPGRETLTGTSGDDVIAGLGGPDRIEGRGGNDVICGGNGHDVMLGGKGDDFCLGAKGRDRAKGCEIAKKL